MENLKQVFKIQSRLNHQARLLKLSYSCDTRILGYDKAETRMEDGTKYSYPETFHVNIEAWSTFKYSFRVSDGKWIREGVDLNSSGLSTAQVYKRVLENIKAHAKIIALHNEADASNCVVFNGALVVVENADAKSWMHPQTVWTLIDENGIESNWYGFGPKEALENAYPFVGRDSRIVMIRLKEEVV